MIIRKSTSNGQPVSSTTNTEQALDTAVITSVLTRYFDGTNYSKNGYSDIISVDNDMTFPIKD